jgi:hypothetical protein
MLKIKTSRAQHAMMPDMMAIVLFAPRSNLLFFGVRNINSSFRNPSIRERKNIQQLAYRTRAVKDSSKGGIWL